MQPYWTKGNTTALSAPCGRRWHHHSGIGLLTPEVVHYGLAEKTQKARGEILSAAYEAHPERFVRKRPVPPSVPAAVWINKPEVEPVSEKTVH